MIVSAYTRGASAGNPGDGATLAHPAPDRQIQRLRRKNQNIAPAVTIINPPAKA